MPATEKYSMPNNALNNCDFEFVKYSEEWIVGTPECFIIVQATPTPPKQPQGEVAKFKTFFIANN